MTRRPDEISFREAESSSGTVSRSWMKGEERSNPSGEQSSIDPIRHPQQPASKNRPLEIASWLIQRQRRNNKEIQNYILDQILTEFDFRYNARKVPDIEHARLAPKGADGKRLAFRDSCAVRDA